VAILVTVAVSSFNVVCTRTFLPTRIPKRGGGGREKQWLLKGHSERAGSKTPWVCINTVRDGGYGVYMMNVMYLLLLQRHFDWNTGLDTLESSPFVRALQFHFTGDRLSPSNTAQAVKQCININPLISNLQPLQPRPSPPSSPLPLALVIHRGPFREYARG
jgi:hypothetical protein